MFCWGVTANQSACVRLDGVCGDLQRGLGWRDDLDRGLAGVGRVHGGGVDGDSWSPLSAEGRSTLLGRLAFMGGHDGRSETKPSVDRAGGSFRRAFALEWRGFCE